MTGRKPHPLDHREYTIRSIRALARRWGFEITDIAGYNFKLVLLPFDRLLPKMTVRQTNALKHLARTKLKFLATAYLVKFRKQ